MSDITGYEIIGKQMKAKDEALSAALEEIERLKLELHNEKQYAEELKKAYDIVQDHLVKAEQKFREKDQTDLITKLRCEAEDKDKLISEFCDALFYLEGLIPQELAQRTREAAK